MKVLIDLLLPMSTLYMLFHALIQVVLEKVRLKYQTYAGQILEVLKRQSVSFRKWLDIQLSIEAFSSNLECTLLVEYCSMDHQVVVRH